MCAAEEKRLQARPSAALQKEMETVSEPMPKTTDVIQTESAAEPNESTKMEEQKELL